MITARSFDAQVDSDASVRLKRNLVVRGVLNSWSGRIGAILFVFIVMLAVIGPFIAPNSPTKVVGVPFASPTWGHVLGLDFLGRDAFSRLLNGGQVVLAVAFLATLSAYAIGIVFGMSAGYRQGVFDLTTVAIVDLMVSFPPIVFVLVFVAGAGTGLAIITIAIAAITVPRVVRLVRAIVLEVTTAEFVEAAVARGERVRVILRRDIFPNILNPLFADFGIRLSASVSLFASISYLGLGQTPPASNWGLMMSENQNGLLVQPWAVVGPAVAIIGLVISVNLISDSVARSVGRSVGRGEV